jgi:hypothetical protein
MILHANWYVPQTIDNIKVIVAPGKKICQTLCKILYEQNI